MANDLTEFLEYIDACPTKWNVNIGFPYGTSYWQVGDSSEQNGYFKVALTKAKQELVTKKSNLGLDFSVDKRDVVKLVKEAWAASFSRVLTNQKAILHCGWGPRALNFNVLLHPEILSSKPEEEIRTVQKVSGLKSDLDAGEFNVTEESAGSLIEQLMLQREKEARTKGANLKEITAKHHATAKVQLTNHEKRCTAGLVASSGKFSLDQEVLGYARQVVEHNKKNSVIKS